MDSFCICRITDILTIGDRVPFVMRYNIREPEHDHIGPDTDIKALENVEGIGIGNTTFYSQYRFFKNDGTNVSSLFGIDTPTGKTIRYSADDYELLDTEFQPNSGSWDGVLVFGLAITQEIGPFSIDATTLYTITSEGAQDTDLGDIFSYNAALSYCLFGQQGISYESPKLAVDAIQEINDEWHDKEEIRGIQNSNSGSNIVYISPGLRFVAGKNISVGASFGILIVPDTGGDQIEQTSVRSTALTLISSNTNYQLVSTFSSNTSW